jgi:hypothetical protein
MKRRRSLQLRQEKMVVPAGRTTAAATTTATATATTMQMMMGLPPPLAQGRCAAG